MAQQRWRAATIAIALAAMAGPAAADALQYQAPEGCPPEATFRAALRAKLPATALDDRGGSTFVATVETDGAQWTALLTVERDGRGAVVARLEDATCEAAVDRLVDATVIAVRDAPSPEPKRSAPFDPERVKAVRLGAGAGWGRNAIGEGFVLDLDATYGDDARFGGWVRVASGSVDNDDHDETREVAAGIEGCLQRRFLELCLRSGAGRLSMTSDYFFDRRISEGRFFIDVGGRLGLLIPVDPRFALRLAAEGGVVSHHQFDGTTSIDPAVSRLRGTVGFVLVR